MKSKSLSEYSSDSQLATGHSPLIPTGYKQTEVGVIPEDWSVVSMDELFTFQNGVNADKASYGKGIPFINVLEVITHSMLTKPKIPGRVSLPYQKSIVFKVHAGDVLFNRTSETQEEVGLASVYIDNKEVVFGGFVIRARPKNDRLDPIFSSYVLRYSSIRQQIVARGQGVVRANIGQRELSNVQVIVPKRSEQVAIAGALSDVDTLIESLEQLITKKRHLKQGVMQELLTGKKRLPGFEIKPGYKQTEVGVIPLDWDVRELESISVISRLAGAEYTSFWKETPDGEVIALRGFNIGKGRIVEKDFVYISNELSLKLKRSRLCKGDVAYPCVGSIGNAVVITEDGKYHIQQNIARITPNFLTISSIYLANYLMSFLGESEVLRFNASSSQPSVLVGSLRQYRIPLPPTKAEQEAIATILTDMDVEIDSLETKLTKTRQLKQGMMQELLTGRIRLV